jgi:hypothetical protein
MVYPVSEQAGTEGGVGGLEQPEEGPLVDLLHHKHLLLCRQLDSWALKRIPPLLKIKAKAKSTHCMRKECAVLPRGFSGSTHRRPCASHLQIAKGFQSAVAPARDAPSHQPAQHARHLNPRRASIARETLLVGAGGGKDGRHRYKRGSSKPAQQLHGRTKLCHWPRTGFQPGYCSKDDLTACRVGRCGAPRSGAPGWGARGATKNIYKSVHTI